jgi:scyllo-inositol 2-dehydrogenase (NADP+)
MRAAQAIADFGSHMKTFNHVDRLLAESDCELVTVITPHNTHATLSVQALEAGRHVVTEKPYTLTVDEATRVIETGRRVGKMATVFHNRRWDGDFQVIRHLVRSGAIGDVFHIECAWGTYQEPRADWWRAYKDISGGALYDWGAHFVDWILNLMPHRIESVAGDFKKLKWHHISNEDYASAYIRFEGGRSASVEAGSLNAIDKPRWRILGTCGGIEKRDWDRDGSGRLKWVTFQDGRRVESDVPYGKNDWDGFYRNVADHLILGEPLSVTPESARKVIAVLNLAEESSKRGGVPLPLPFEQ